jgi:S1-C subfamily serine protease
VTSSTKTRIFLSALAAVVLSIVGYDVWRPPEIATKTLPQVAPEVPPTARRMLDKTPLLYEGEYLENLLDRLRPALVSARPDPDDYAITTTGFVVAGDGSVLVSLVSSAPKWHVRTASGDVAEGELAGVDAIHGLALLRTKLPGPLVTLPIATGIPLTTVEPLIGMQSSAAGGEVRLLAKAVSVSSYDEMLDDSSLRPGEVALDADGRLRAFGAETEDGPAPLYAYELEDIVKALSTKGRHPHPWLGLELQTVDGPLRSYFTDGALVTVHVEPDSPADQAGFKPGMAFVEARAGDRTAHTSEGVDNILEVGQTIEFEPVPAPRQKAPPKPVSVVVADRQTPLPVGTHGVDSFGLMAATAQPGVEIVVGPGGEAAAHGLVTGDVVEAVDLRAVTSARALQRALVARPAHGAHLVTVRRGHDRFFTLLEPAAAAAVTARTRHE